MVSGVVAMLWIAVAIEGGVGSAVSLLAEESANVESPDLAEARRLYARGRTYFEATDYGAAIEAFTSAFALVPESEVHDQIRLTLLYNIAAAHEKAYEIDDDADHLRQALSLYERYEEFAERTGDLGEQLDVGVRVSRLRRLLNDLDDAEAQPRAAPQRSEHSGKWKKSRNAGIGLVAAGGAALVGGVVLAMVGAPYEQNARDQVAELADLGVPSTHPAWAEGDDFIAAERRKGVALMVVGGALAVVAAIAVGLGVRSLVRARRYRPRQQRARLIQGLPAALVEGRF